MAQLRQIGMSITPNYTPKKTVGEGLANLLLTGMDTATKFQAENERQDLKQKRDDLEKDSQDIDFIRAKINTAYNEGKIKSNQDVQDYIDTGITKDEEYISRFGGSKNINEILRREESIDKWRYTSSTVVKELGKTPEQIEAERIRKQEADDAIIYNDFVTTRDTRFTDAGFEQMSFAQKKEFMKQEIELVKNSEHLNSFGSDKFKNLVSGMINENKRLYSEYGYAQDKEIVSNTLSNFVNSYVGSSDSISNDVIDLTVESVNELMPANEQIKKEDIYLKIAEAVDFELRANENAYIEKGAKYVKEKFPVLSKIKDPKQKGIIKARLDSIQAKTDILNETKDIISGKRFISNSSKESQELTKQTVNSNFEIAYKNGNIEAMQKEVAFATANNITIGSIENDANAFTDFIDNEQSTSAPEAGFAMYQKISQAQTMGYKINNSKISKEISKLETLANLHNQDISTSEGFANTLNIYNAKKAAPTYGNKLTKEDTDEMYSSISDVLDTKGDGIIKGALNTLFSTPLAKDKDNLSNLKIPETAKQKILEQAKDLIELGSSMDNAVETATQNYIKRFKDTGFIDLEDAGVYSSEDYKQVFNEIQKETSRKISSIERFNNVIQVSFGSEGDSDYKQERYSINDISSKLKRIRDVVSTPVIMSDEVKSKNGGSEKGFGAIDLAMASDGVYTNKDFRDEELGDIKNVIAYYSKDMNEGETLDITPKMVNAYYGIDSTLEFKDNYITNLSDIKLRNEKGKAFNFHAIVGKTTIIKGKDGSISFDPKTTQYDFTDKDRSNMDLFTKMLVPSSKNKYVKLMFTKEQLLDSKINISNNKTKNADSISRKTGIPKSTVIKYGLYDLQSKKFEGELSYAYEKSLEKYGNNASEKDIMSGVLTYMKGKFGNDFTFNDPEYGFGPKALKFMNSNN